MHHKVHSGQTLTFKKLHSLSVLLSDTWFTTLEFHSLSECVCNESYNESNCKVNHVRYIQQKGEEQEMKQQTGKDKNGGVSFAILIGSRKLIFVRQTELDESEKRSDFGEG